MAREDIDAYAQSVIFKDSEYVCSYRYHWESRGRGGPQSSFRGINPVPRGVRDRGKAPMGNPWLRHAVADLVDAGR